MEYVLPILNSENTSPVPFQRHTVAATELEMAKEAQVDLTEAVREHYRRIYYFSLHLSQKPADAADLTQHAYEMLARKKHTISDPAKVKSWLHSTVYRKFIDQKRRSARFPSVELEEDSLPPEHEREYKDNKIDAKAALKALEQLSDDLRAPLPLF